CWAGHWPETRRQWSAATWPLIWRPWRSGSGRPRPTGCAWTRPSCWPRRWPRRGTIMRTAWRHWRGSSGPADVARRLGDPARPLEQALAGEKDAQARVKLAVRRAAVAAWLAPPEAGRLLSEALAREANSNVHAELANGLAALADRLAPAEAGAAARSLAE